MELLPFTAPPRGPEPRSGALRHGVPVPADGIRPAPGPAEARSGTGLQGMDLPPPSEGKKADLEWVVQLGQ